MKRINIIIGATSLLGKHLKFNKKDHWVRLTREQCDITITDTSISNSLYRYFDTLPSKEVPIVERILWLAAYTNVAKSNSEKELVYKTNVESIRNIIGLLSKGFDGGYHLDAPHFTYISTDYVFDGEAGNYKTTDIINPVKDNYYAMSKSLAETIVSTYPHSLTIRTSFCRSDIWPFPMAFTDQYTSRDFVEIIAPKMIPLIESKTIGIKHIGTERKSVYDLAKRIDPNVKPGSRLSIKNVYIPFDNSLGDLC